MLKYFCEIYTERAYLYFKEYQPCLGITPVGLPGQYGVPSIKPRLAVPKARALAAVLPRQITGLRKKNFFNLEQQHMF